MVAMAGGLGQTIRCADWKHTALWAFHGEVDASDVRIYAWMLAHVRSRTR